MCLQSWRAAALHCTSRAALTLWATQRPTRRPRQISGAIITPTSVVLMAYALFMFKRRTRNILRREAVSPIMPWSPSAACCLCARLHLYHTLNISPDCSGHAVHSSVCNMQSRLPQVRFDDQRGPVLLTLLLAAVTVLAFALTVASLGAWGAESGADAAALRALALEANSTATLAH